MRPAVLVPAIVALSLTSALVACDSADEPALQHGGESGLQSRAPQPSAAELAAPAASVQQDDASGELMIAVNGNVWSATVEHVGAAPLTELSMLDTDGPATPPPAGSEVTWVCFDARQLVGDDEVWLGDDFRFELRDGDTDTRYDAFTGFDYRVADESRDIYFASGNSLGEPYEGICDLFVVPEGIANLTVTVVPDGADAFVVTAG